MSQNAMQPGGMQCSIDLVCRNRDRSLTSGKLTNSSSAGGETEERHRSAHSSGRAMASSSAIGRNLLCRPTIFVQVIRNNNLQNPSQFPSLNRRVTTVEIVPAADAQTSVEVYGSPGKESTHVLFFE
jgi:hypothetical protein